MMALFFTHKNTAIPQYPASIHPIGREADPALGIVLNGLCAMGSARRPPSLFSDEVVLINHIQAELRKRADILWPHPELDRSSDQQIGEKKRLYYLMFNVCW